MYELRILSGLHRGATLPLDDHPHLIGASDDADVVLVDGCITEQHATLTRTNSGWILTAGSGKVFAADSNFAQSLIDLEEGDFARLGDVWLMVVHENAEWTDPPPLPIDDLFEPDVEARAPESEEAIAAPALQDIGDPAPLRIIDDVDNDQKPVQDRPARRLLLIPVAAVVVLSAAAAYAMSSRSASDTLPQKLNLIMSDSLSIGTRADKGRKSGAAEAATGDAAVKAVRVLSQDELQKAFRKKLSDADLLKRFDINLADRSWNLQGDLNNEETKRFERILQAFMKQNNITFPVNAKIVSAESMLPFKIRQVITGANASVVTQDGERLYVGEEYRGVRVVAIQDNHLTFAGKRKIEMNW